MFSLSELEEDPDAISEIAADIREECEKFGEILNVTLYDREKDGVVSIKFSDPESALECVRVNDGRMFAGQKIEAYIFDGTERFRKKGKQRENDEDEEKRLEAFGDWLEEGAPEDEEQQD